MSQHACKGTNYESEAPPPPPPPPDYIVTGVLDPNATGDYNYLGVFGAATVYQRVGGGFYLWGSAAMAEWYISITYNNPAPPVWVRLDPNIEGEYTPVGVYTGTATVTAGS